MARGSGARHAAFLLLAGLAITVWVHRIHIDHPSERHFLYETDLFIYCYPSAMYLHNELQSGNLPIWNPYQLAGQPFLAMHMPAVLYPPNILLMGLLRPARALEAHAVLHLLIAGFFTWLFAARLGLGFPACLAAAVGYMLSGPLLMAVYFTATQATNAWLPAILWGMHGLLTEARLKWAVSLAVLLSLAFLGGYAQAFLYEIQIAFAYGVFGLFFLARPSERWRVFGLAILAGVLAFGLVAPQLLPSLELTAAAVRNFGGLSYGVAATAAVKLETLLTGLLGQLGSVPAFGGVAPWRWVVTLPVLGLPLIACGWLAPRQRAHWVFFAAATTFVGFFLLGSRTRVFEFYYSLPLGDLFRLPNRMAFVYALLTALLIAIGIEGVSGRLRKAHTRAFVPGAVGGLLALIVCVDTYTRTKMDSAHPILEGATRGAPSELIAFLRGRSGRERVFIETMGWNTSLIHKAGMMNGVFAVPGYEPSVPAAYQQYFNGPRTPPWLGNVNLVSAPKGRTRPDREMARLLDLMSVRYYAGVSFRRALERFVGAKTALRLGEAFVIERGTALPRTYAVHQVEVEADAERALTRLLGDSFDPTRTAVVDREVRALGPPAGIDSAAITSYASEEVRLAAHCASDCLLVLTDLHYPGWEATVDGEPTEIYRVNHLFRGVRLPAGSHEITYRYRPRSFRIGVALLAATLLLTTGTLAYSWLRVRMAARVPT